MTLFKYVRWGCVVLMVSLLTACSMIGRPHMAASELFDPATAQLLEDIRHGDEVHAREALAQGLNLNIHGKEGVTPLEWLILETRNKKVVMRGLKLGANPNFKNGNGNAPINMVAGFSDLDWLRIMLDAGGDPNNRAHMGMSPLFDAITEERWPAIRLLLARGADVNLPDKVHKNPAIYASYLDKYEIVYQLIEQGTDINVYDDTGSDLAVMVYESESIMSKSSRSYPWLMKVKQVLVERGKTFPPPSPSEIRRQWKENRH